MGGANVSRQLTKQTRVNGSYRLNYVDAATLTDLTRQNFLPTGTALYYENSRRQNTNTGTMPPPGWSIRVLQQPQTEYSFQFSDATNNSQSSRQSFSVADTLVMPEKGPL
jgi:hypothetical protein